MSVRYDIKTKSRKSVSVVGISEDVGNSRYHDNYGQSVVGKSPSVLILYELAVKFDLK